MFVFTKTSYLVKSMIRILSSFYKIVDLCNSLLYINTAGSWRELREICTQCQ